TPMETTISSAGYRRVRFAIAAVCIASIALGQKPTTAGNTKNQEEPTLLSPFLVQSGKDEGYSSQQTLIGSRSAKDLISIPASVAIIGKQLIEDLNAVSIEQAMIYGASGVTVNQQAQEDITIRGFRSTVSLRNGIS